VEELEDDVVWDDIGTYNKLGLEVELKSFVLEGGAIGL
jgi:hypothetical protein